MAAPYATKGVFATKLTEYTPDDREGIGTLRWQLNCCYKWVRYHYAVGLVSAVAASCAYYHAVSKNCVTQGYENNVVTMDATDGLVPAGILMSAIPHNYYGWIQIKGPATLATGMVASGADGKDLTIGTTDGSLLVRAAVTTSHTVAYATDASEHKICCDFPF